MPESPLLFSSVVPACGFRLKVQSRSRGVQKQGQVGRWADRCRGIAHQLPTASGGPQAGRWQRAPQRLDSSTCRVQNRRNKARMSMKTKGEVKKSSGQAQSLVLTHPSPGSPLSPPSLQGRGLATRFGLVGDRGPGRRVRIRVNVTQNDLHVRDQGSARVGHCSIDFRKYRLGIAPRCHDGSTGKEGDHAEKSRHRFSESCCRTDSHAPVHLSSRRHFPRQIL
jgi:hypothetical protein